MKFPELKYERIPETPEGKKYRLLSDDYTYFSRKYGKSITVKKGKLSDGATGAFDIYSWGWWIHDEVTDTGLWDDGTKCNNWQASTVLATILKEEGRYARSVYWWFATWLFGGKKARENGLF